MIHSPNRLIIDLSALVYNLNQVKKLIGPKTKIMGIVKSDAYGHGLLQVSRALEKSGVHCLGVAQLHEAMELRRDGIRLPIVLLSGILTREEAHAVIEKNISPVIFDLALAEALNEESIRKGKKTNIHLKVDTGMGRLGVSHEELGPFLRKIVDYKGLCLEALISHLSSADEPESDFTRAQINHFKKAIKTGNAMGLNLHMNNLANSAGIMAYGESYFDMVRPGIMLYGGLPSPGFQGSPHLKPVMHFKGRILQIRDLPDQTPVSYGRTYHTSGPQRIAVLSAGYGDGLPRSMSNRGHVMIGGKKVPIVGRVCMNMIMCDITELKVLMPGDEVVFLGRQGDEIITGDHMAGWSKTISYEIFCSIGQSNNKEYIL